MSVQALNDNSLTVQPNLFCPILFSHISEKRNI